MSAAAQQQKIRRIVLTGAIAAVTATGAWYGAGLKIQRDTKKVKFYIVLIYLPPFYLVCIFQRSKGWLDGY